MLQDFELGPPRKIRRPSLTPMIDVVFLLLVFFMLASRFGMPANIPMNAAIGGDGGWQGAPRLVEAFPDSIKLNGEPLDRSALNAKLAPLMPTNDSPIILRASAETNLQRLLEVAEILRDAGFDNLVLVE